MKRFVPFAAALLAAFLAAPAMADSFGIRIVDDDFSIRFGFGAPPAPYEYAPPGPPGAVWAPGYWNWNGYRYVWTQGRWIAAAPPAVIHAPPAALYPIAPRWGFEARRDFHHPHRGRDHGGWQHRPHRSFRDR